MKTADVFGLTIDQTNNKIQTAPYRSCDKILQVTSVQHQDGIIQPNPMETQNS